MNELVGQINLGDITFGVPQDIEVLNSPFGYYSFLGVPRTATKEQILAAYREKSRMLHPDMGGNKKDFQALQKVFDVLLDDGGDLGTEHSKRRHYDKVSGLDDFFDGHIEIKGDRTKKLSEIMLIHLELYREQAKLEHKVTQRFPEYPKLVEELKRAQSEKSREEIAEQILGLRMEVAGIPPEKREGYFESVKEQEKSHEKRIRKFIERLRENPGKYFSKVLDIFYADDKDVTFGLDIRETRMAIGSYEELKHILRLVITGSCYLFGIAKVHFKAPEAQVKISDPNLEGIVHVVNGNIDVSYHSSSYGSIIRARAPEVSVVRGFVKNKDLYVPERFAQGEWTDKKPALDLAVKEGRISLDLSSPKFSPRKLIISYIEEIISGDEYNNIIKKK